MNPNPFDPASCLGISSIALVPQQGTKIRWRTVGGMRYRVQRAMIPKNSAFVDMPRSAAEEKESDVPEGQPHWMEYLDPSATTASGSRFYRILLVP